MADAVADDGRCLLSTCDRSGPLQRFKLRGVKKLIECAQARQDNTTLDIVQAILDSEGDQASVEVHKDCYCTFTSKHHVNKSATKKRKDNSADDRHAETPPTARLRRSQMQSFELKKQCLFCAELCKPIDSKNPARWDRVVQCEVMGVANAQPFKDAVLGICADRSDAWSREIAIRISGVHDLAAAEAQYHHRCYNEFRAINVYAVQSTMVDDDAMMLLANEMYAERNLRTWTYIDLYNKYVAYGGLLIRKQICNNLVKHFGDNVIVLHMEGCASIIGFKEFMRTILHIVKEDAADEDKDDQLVRKITAEARAIPFLQKTYDLGDFTYEKTRQQTSETLLKLISKLVSNGEVTKASLSLSQAIQSRITNTRNQTTLGLGVKLYHKFGSRELIHLLYEHGFIASYDEVRRFRKSAAKYVGDNIATLHRMMGLSKTVGIVFGWYDNFDLLVSTPNGRRETHAMATEFQQHPAGIVETGSAQAGISSLQIPRLTSKQAITVGSNRALELLHYTGPKKVMPPALSTSHTVGMSFTELCARQTSLLAAQEKDVLWLNSLNQPDAMEWNGFNNQHARSEGLLKPASTYMFGPLIDAPPSHPDTIITTLTYMQRSLVDMGMTYVHVSIDMQLFVVTKQVCWHRPLHFQNVVVHPGGMHIIQSFIGCIAKLMKGSALDVYLTAAYRGLTGILNGKSWVKAMRAFRGVAAALLKRFLSTGPKSFEQIEEYLDLARLHPTGRHWVDNFLLPTLLIHQFERAEREGDIYLKQLTMERMLKYFFLAGHVQYARYITQYLLEMRHLPAEAKKDLVSGAFVCRHHEGYWNAVSGDQFGEQTAIRIGKGAMKGMTLSPNLVSEWIDAFPITVHVSDRLDSIYSTDSPSQSAQTKHKEEQKHRRVLDTDDRALVDKELSKYSHPLEEKRNHLYNPVTGQIAPDDVNVADSLLIGERMVECYTTSLPGGFYAPISSAIKTMGTARKTPKGRDKQSIDLESIFIRLMMIGQRRQLELGPLFDYELCAVPAALIDDQGCLRKGNKSALVKRLGVVESTPTDPDIVIVDVQQLLYRIVWPHGGSPCDVITSIGSRLDRYPHTSEKVIVFDKYENVSAKDHERLRRSSEEATSYELTLTCVLPKRDLIMNSKSNKRRLASVLSTFTVGEMVTMDSADDGVFKHDEADVTMISYVIEAANSGKGTIRVLSDDTDVFVLLVYWVYRLGMVCKIQMERWDGTVLDINATCTNLGPKCMQLLGMHAISGCDTTSYPYAKGKASALKTILDGDFPGLDDVLGEVGATNDDLLQVATTFFLALYGQPAETSINRARFTLYTRKKKSPKVKALPPTSSNLMLHVMRAHLQAMLWKSADQQAPPVESEDITGFGWKLQDGVPVPVVADREPAPPQLSDVINCQCKAAGKKCSTEACGCHKEHLSCTSYCNCRGEDGCCNPHTTQGVAQAADDDDEDVEDEEEDAREEVEDIEEDTVLAVDGEDDNADEWD